VLQPSGRPTASNRAGISAPAFSKVCGHLGKLSPCLGPSLTSETSGNCRKIPITLIDNGQWAKRRRKLVLRPVCNNGPNPNLRRIHGMACPTAVSTAHTCTVQFLWLHDSQSGAMIFC